MKKTASIFLSALLAVCTAVPCCIAEALPVCAEENEILTTWDGIEYRIDEDSVTVCGYDYRAGNYSRTVTIPAEIDGLPVTKLAAGAFANHSSIDVLTIEAPITEIPDFCFQECSIKTINLPDTLTTIGYQSFYYNDGLETINLPDSVTDLGMSSFSGSKVLKSFTVPKGVTTMNMGNLYDCAALTELTIPATVTEFIGDLLGCSPDLVLCVEPGSAAETYAKEHDFPYAGIGESVQFIRSDSGYSYLLKEDGVKLYRYDGTEKSVTVPAEVDGHPVTALADNLFRRTEAEFVEIEAPITALPDYCFAYTPLKSVVLPDTLTSIGKGAFSYTELEEILIPRSVTEIGESAFHGCKFTEILIPDGVRRIETDTFICCFDLKTVHLPASLEYIGLFAFSNTGIESVVIPEGVTVDRQAFCACDALTSITFPQSMTSIPFGCCMGDKQLTSIVFPDALTEIGDEAFMDCEALTSVKCPSALETIGKKAFCECFALADVQFNDGLKTIGEAAFANAQALEEVKIPASVTEIGQWAFTACADPLTIYGYIGSAAQDYALSDNEDWYFVFVPLDQTLITGVESTADVTQTETTVTTAVPHIAADETLCEWAVQDYLKRTGIKPNASLAVISANEYEITLSDADGKVLEVYTVDPYTGIGTNTAKAAVNLPQTGNNSVTALLWLLAAAALLGCGIFSLRAAHRMRRTDETA